MIGTLPASLTVNGTDKAILCDFRIALLIFQALSDPDLSDREKAVVTLHCLYVHPESIQHEDYNEALVKAFWYLDGGGEETVAQNGRQQRKLFDWEQDESYIFSAINKVAGFEVREKEYLHWWTFLGYFSEIGEGLFNTIVGIRSKKAYGKKLDAYEKEFCRKHPELIKIKVNYSEEQKKVISHYENLLNKYKK